MAENKWEAEDRVEGKNAVMEALKAGRPLDKIYIARGEQDKALRFIAQKGKAAGAVISETDRRKLDAMSVTHAHQGVIAVAAVREYSTVADILALARAKGEEPLIVVCATRSPIPIIWARSSAPRNARGPTASSSRSTATPASPPWWRRPAPGRRSIWPSPGWRT